MLASVSRFIVGWHNLLVNDDSQLAYISEDGLYRYRLSRLIGDTKPGDTKASRVLFVMLNPSTADAAKDDPTIRRCIGFATRWGMQRLDVVNLFAFRATQPRDLFDQAPSVAIGDPENLNVIRLYASMAKIIVCAWGVHGHRFDRDREVMMCGLCDHAFRLRICSLGETKSGFPRHPLYVRNDVNLKIFEMA